MKNLNYLFIALMPIFIMCTSKKEVASDEQDLKPDTTVVDTGQLDQTEQPDKSKEGIWEVVNVVDEFGDVVEGKTAILSLIDGKMSNSAVVDEKVTVKIQINIKDQTMLMSFFEYGNSPGSLPENKFLNLHIKKGDNSTEFVELFCMSGYLHDTKGELLSKVLEQDSPLKVIADLKRLNMGLSTVYNFAIDPTGLKDLLPDK